MNKKTGLVFATRIESERFIKGFDMSGIEDKPFEIYNINMIYLIISGIGKANAAMAASYLIWKFKIKNIYNIGAAGSTGLNYKLGEIYHINKVIEYDRPRLIKKSLRILEPDCLTGFSMASLATQDRPVIDTAQRKKMSEYADLVDMEGAAVIQACRLWNTKCYLFKFITDTPEHAEENIIKNIDKIGKKMFEFFKTRVLK
jgi:adenosylhomocysteine nucleosidase